MNRPKVSVVMGVFNGDLFLSEAVESILCQSFRDLELIVIDDGSTDATAKLLDNYQNQDPRVRVFHQENVGLIESLNRGAALARGTYIARMDADDIALKDRLALQVSVLEKDPGLGLLGGAIELINSSGMGIGFRHFPTTNDEIRSGLLDGMIPISHPAVVMRTRAFLSVGGYRKVAMAAEDYDLWLRISDGYRLANLDTVILRYRWHPEQVSVKKVRQQLLSTLGAQTAALLRSRGGPDPLESIAEITPAVLTALGVSQEKQRARVIRGYLSRIRWMSDAGDQRAARVASEAMLNSPEWKDAEIFLVADFGLLSARIYWRQQRFLKSIATAIRAFFTRPVMLGRPLKPLLRLFQLRGPAL